MPNKVGFPINPFPPPPIIYCLEPDKRTAISIDQARDWMTKAHEHIIAQEQRIAAWQQIDKKAESMVPKGDDGPLSTYMNLPPIRSDLIQWARTVDLDSVVQVHCTLKRK